MFVSYGLEGSGDYKGPYDKIFTKQKFWPCGPMFSRTIGLTELGCSKGLCHGHFHSLGTKHMYLFKTVLHIKK